MTRKERIEQESAINAAYIGGLEIAGDLSEEKLQTYQNGFINGAEWADKNPANPWISVKDDLPSNHKELIHSYRYTVPVLIRCNDSRHHIIRMYRLNDKDWGWIDYAKSITHWMPIPKLQEDLL